MIEKDPQRGLGTFRRAYMVRVVRVVKNVLHGKHYGFVVLGILDFRDRFTCREFRGNVVLVLDELVEAVLVIAATPDLAANLQAAEA